MRWPLRKKLFVTVGGGAAAIAVVMSLMVDLTVVDQIYKYEELGLAQTRAAFEAQQKYQRSQLLERCRLVSDLPYFKAAVAVYDPTLPAAEQNEALATVSDVAQRILYQTDVDLLTLTGLDGVPLLAVGPAVEHGINDLSPIQRISQEAIRHTASDGYLVLGGGLTYVTAVRIEVGGLQLGTLCLGTSLDEGMANSLEDMTGSAVALMGRNEVLAVSAGVPAGATSNLEHSWAKMLHTTTGSENRAMLKINRDRFRTLWLPLQGPDQGYLGAFVVMRSEDRALTFLSDVRRGLLGIAVASMIVALFFSYLFARQITNPIQRLVAFTRRVGSGDLSGGVDIGTRDELAQLGSAFNSMTRNLGESRHHLEASNKELAQQKSELETANLDLQQSKEKSEKANRDLQEAHSQLLQAGKMVAFGELGASLAHELRQPLSAVRGFAQLAQMKLSPEETDIQGHLGMVIQSVDHMTKTVQSLKNFARKSDNEFSDVNINEILDLSCLLVSSQFRAARIKIEKTLDENAQLIHGDANQLQQVFVNLLSNAGDSMEETGGVVKVKTRSVGDGSYVLVTISDTGAGIPEEMVPQIFNSFFTTKPEGKGTGLGLSITEGIIKNHGGYIDVESQIDKGTVFRTFLPSRLAKKCWETIDCVKDCRPEISGKEECAVYLENRGHGCWEALAEMARHDSRVTQPECERCPVYTNKMSIIDPESPEAETPRAA